MVAKSVAGSIYGRGSVYSDASIGSISCMLYAAELQQHRSLRMLQNISRQAENEADRQLHFAEKQAAREDHLAAFEELQAEAQRRRAARAKVREQQRKERAEAAALHEQQMRDHAHRKVMAVEQRAEELAMKRLELAEKSREHAAQVAARREAAFHTAISLAESRKMSLKARQAAADRIAREREEVKALERTIAEERAYRKEEARAAARERAEADLMQRTMSFVRKGQAKNEALESWHHSASMMRRMRSEEARERAEYITMQAQMAAEADAERRAQWRSIAISKAQRVEAIKMERDTLAEQMNRQRYGIAQQEQAMRCSLDALRHGSLASAGPLLAAALAADAESSCGRRSGYAASVALSFATTMRSARSRVARSVSAASAAGRGKGSRPSSAFAPLPTAPEGARRRPRRHSVHDAIALPVITDGVVIATTGLSPREGAPFVVPQAVMAGSADSAAAADIARREEELRAVLREEIDKETERQTVLAATTDNTEAMRLAAEFAAERDAAKQRILALSAALQESTAAAAAAATAQATAPGQVTQPGAPAKSTFHPAAAAPLDAQAHAAKVAAKASGKAAGASAAKQVTTPRRDALPDYGLVGASAMEKYPLMAQMQRVSKAVPVA